MLSLEPAIAATVRIVGQATPCPPAEEAQVVTVLTSSRYAGLSPKQLVPQLADEGLYLASESTMYRVPRRHGLRTKGPTSPRTHVTRASTVHRATGPNQVWSWDITWLPTTVRGAYLYLYLTLGRLRYLASRAT